MLNFIFKNYYGYLITITLATFMSLSHDALGVAFFVIFFITWLRYLKNPERKFAGWMYSGRLYDDLNKIPEKFRKMAGKVYYEG
jgi:hypothetical protein